MDKNIDNIMDIDTKYAHWNISKEILNEIETITESTEFKKFLCNSSTSLQAPCLILEILSNTISQIKKYEGIE